MELYLMISKIERVIEYIARLEAGEKVSVRKLAQELGVSEGTAYKSIKQAEAQGLVTTKPKVGTVRITLRSATADPDSTMAEAARSVGAVCICGAERIPAYFPLLSNKSAKKSIGKLINVYRK